MNDTWANASRSFANGNLATARSNVENLISTTPSSHSLTRSIHSINQHACSLSPSYLPALPPSLTSSTPPVLQLLAQEAALTASYNSNLTARTDPVDSRTNIINTAKWLWSRVAGASPPASDPRAMFRALVLEGDPMISKDGADFAEMASRWAEVSAAIYELSAAIHIQSGKSSEAISLAAGATELREIAIAFSTAVTLARSNSSTSNDRMITHEDSENKDESNPMFQNEYSMVKYSEAETDEAQAADIESARGRWLLGCAHANEGTWDAALSALTPSSAHHLPSAYVGAVIYLRRGRIGDNENARKLLELCVMKGHRLSDSLSLLARGCEGGSSALPKWKRALTVDARRPAALWIAAGDFGRAGKPRQQAELLRVLENVVQNGSMDDTKGENELKIGADGIVSVKEIVSLENIRRERARALSASEEWDKARKLFEELPEEIRENGNVARDMALTAAACGETEDAIDFAEIAKATNVNGALLAKAEALMNDGKPIEAAEAIREELRTVVGGSSRMNDSDGMCMLRGVCFHNLGVGHVCSEEYMAADECFAAAQTAFAKCGEMGKQMELLSTYSRCLSMWASGEEEDAAAHWVKKRDLNVDCEITVSEEKLPRPSTHVLHDVSDLVLQKMDQICLKICTTSNAQDMLKEIVDNVEKKWPL